MPTATAARVRERACHTREGLRCRIRLADGRVFAGELLAERPCHLLIESGGSGGAHAYWKLAEPLQATHLVEGSGELLEPIERAHLRIIRRLGVGADGKPNVADPACAERSRVMRLAGTVNGKTGAFARIVEADFQLPPYPIEQLVGDLPDPASHGSRRVRRDGASPDPY